MALACTEVKKIAQVHKLRIYQPESINSQESAEFLKRLNPDVFIVVAFGQILNRDILAIPKILCLNLHASLLPKYRGAAPIRWAIIKGETRTGLTVIKMAQELDAGQIILQKKINIQDSDDAFSLEEKLSHLGSDLVLQALDLIQADRYSLIIQDEREATLAPKLKKEDGLIHWDKSARDIFNLIRGCAGWPGAFSYYRGKILKIHKASLFLSACIPDNSLLGVCGRILQMDKLGIVIATGEGNLLIEELQIEGRRRMSAAEFISGYRVSIGEDFGEKK